MRICALLHDMACGTLMQQQQQQPVSGNLLVDVIKDPVVIKHPIVRVLCVYSDACACVCYIQADGDRAMEDAVGDKRNEVRTQQQWQRRQHRQRSKQQAEHADSSSLSSTSRRQ